MKFALALLAVVAAEEAAKKKANEECTKNDDCDTDLKCCGFSSDDEKVQKAITDAKITKKCFDEATQKVEVDYAGTKVAPNCTDGAKALAATAVAALAIFANM